MTEANPKRKIYARKWPPYLNLSDNHPRPWFLGIEYVQMVDGHRIAFVALEDGSGGPLEDFLVMDDRGATVRPPDDAHKFIWNVPSYMAEEKESMFLGIVKNRYSDAPITDRENSYLSWVT